MTLISAQLRDEVVQRAKNRFEYCHLVADSQVATFPIDHIRPLFMAGLTESENLALACPRCNAKKWTHTEASDPQTGVTTLLFNPRTHDWREHFRWSDHNRCLLEAITAIGRTTLDFLDMNSPKHLVIRSLLEQLELHPPQDDR